MRLQGKVALITGAGGGIGRVTSVLFGQEGARLLLTDIDEKAGRETLAEVTAAGGEAEFVAGDLAVEADAARIAEAAVSRFGRIDVLFNNAGVTRVGTAETLAVENLDLVYRVNVRGPFLMIKYVVPVMRRQGGGSIINMGSTASLVATVNMTAYGVTKAAILGLTRAAAADYARENIRVNCLCPGATLTPLLQKINRERSEAETAAFVAKHPIGRFAEPIEIARAALFLASDDSSYMTGAAMAVDGGMTAL